ncbi:MAG TPA: PASTA domain-containing protein, partial [Actinotalea sp.]|nr:PASTA domain-containing protein [Actinotalea sp.]
LGFPEVSGSMLRGVQVKVPDLGGMSVDAARRALNEAKLNVIVGSEVFSNRPAGSVASTDPAAGASVVRGTAVTLFISRGPEPVPQTPPPAAPGLGPGGPGGGGGGGGGGFPWPPPGRGDG